MNKKTIALTLLSSAISFHALADDIRFITYDGTAISHNKETIDKQSPALQTLLKEANKALKSSIDPVTNKTLMPASGNAHDYFSFGPYWWPNPDTKDGLPYVRRDGEYNMDTKTAATDKQRMITFAHDVKELGLAYYFTDDAKYAEKAKQQLNAWFIDPKTRMNPNMDYAQAIPGIVDGRGIGIIDSRLLIGVMDSVELIKPTLSADEYKSIVKWFADFKDWLLTSNNGFEEDNWHNNHGTWFDAQVVAFSIFTNDIDTAKQRLRITQMRRIGSQFDIEGKQHAELERTQPWHYSNFNLEAYNLLGHYGDLVGVDVWNYEIDKHSLKNGYRFIAEHVTQPDAWPYKELKGFDASKAYTTMLNANKAYGDEVFSKALKSLQENKKTAAKVETLLF
ncbi:alginate lyase family protein [Vibrio rumoiensis]|uniref:alginate lyase family protein n=1 Tax=Vibrio rumoiensis TaxID=76258 RepID=UPI000B5C7C9D|nr:alginate lyase family protein [Vibrio rumoiensis]